MKKELAITVVFLLTILIPIAEPFTEAAGSLAPPTVNLPNSHWQQTNSTAYPNAPSEFDPEGAGMLEYVDQNNYDIVRIYYEKAQVSSYTLQELEYQAVNIFERIDSSATLSVDQSGNTSYAGVSVGFAKGHNDTINAYTMVLVFIKGEYYFKVGACYDDVQSSQNAVDSIINSISISGAAGGQPFIWFYIIIGAAVASIVIVVAVVVLARRKKSPRSEQQPQPGIPPPPPPTP